MENADRQIPSFFRFIKAVADVTGKIAAYFCGSLVFVMFAIVTLQIFSRTFGITISWTEEASRYLLIWVGMLAAGIALKEGGHAAIGFIAELFSKRVQRVLSILIELAILVFFIIFFKTSLNAALDAREILASAFEMTMLWPKLALPVGTVFMMINCVYLIAFDLTILMNGEAGGAKS